MPYDPWVGVQPDETVLRLLAEEEAELPQIPPVTLARLYELATLGLGGLLSPMQRRHVHMIARAAFVEGGEAWRLWGLILKHRLPIVPRWSEWGPPTIGVNMALVVRESRPVLPPQGRAPMLSLRG